MQHSIVVMSKEYFGLVSALYLLQNLEHKNAALQAELASLQSFNKKEAEQLSKRLE